MNLNSHVEGLDVLVIALREDNLDASNVREFRDAMDALLAQRAKAVLDLDGVKFVDSSGLGALIACQRQLSARQGDLRLCALSQTVRALFDLMRMNRVFSLHASRAEAVASFG